MKKTAHPKKLHLSRETLGSLKQSRLTDIRGGMAPEADLNLAYTSNASRAQPCCDCA